MSRGWSPHFRVNICPCSGNNARNHSSTFSHNPSKYHEGDSVWQRSSSNAISFLIRPGSATGKLNLVHGLTAAVNASLNLS